ncbi:MAG TPA: MFS transporter [Syntrophorhabdales bacterium]|nr:MFS transporter [Syntrophorhabdales bacterium]
MTRKLSPALLLFILTGINLFNYLDRYVLSAVRSPMADDFGLSYGESGRLFTAFMLGYFLTSPVFGYLGDRASRKVLICIGIFVWSVGTVLTGFAQSFALLLCFRAMVGVGEASYATLSPSLIADSFGPEKRNNALTLFYTAIPVGSALGYILGGEIASHWGWRQAFYWAGAPGLLLALVLLPFREAKRGESEGREVAKPRTEDLVRLFITADYNIVVWGYVAYTFALGAFAFWGPTFFERVHRLPTAQADNFFGGMIVVAGVAGSLIGGFLATAWKRSNRAGYALLLCTSVFAAVPLSFLALVVQTTPAAMTLLSCAIFLLFFCTGPVNTLILETVPANVRSSAMAVSIFMIHLFGDMYSPEAVGRLADHLGNDLRKAILILPAALLIAALLWMLLALRITKAGRTV